LTTFCLANLAKAQGNTFYSQGSDSFDVTTNWDTNQGGGGTDPSDFTSGDDFIIQSGHTITLNISSARVLSLTIDGGGTFNNFSHNLQIGEQDGSGGLLDIQGTYTASTGEISFFNAGFGGTPTYSIQSSNSAETFNDISFNDGSLSFSHGTSATFTINGTLKIGSGAGAVSAATGNVTLSYGDDSIIEYAPGSNYTIDEEWTSTIDAASVTINSSGNTISVPTGAGEDRTIGKTLTLTAGTLSISSDNDLIVLGDIVSSDIAGSGSITSAGTGIVTLGDGTTTNSQTITGSPTLSNLTVNKGGSGTANDVDISGNPTITNDFNITAGDVDVTGSVTVSTGDINVNGGTLTNSGAVTVSGGSSLILVATGASFSTGSGATSITTNEIELESGATYSTGGKSITSLSILTLHPNSTFEFSGSSVETTPLSSPIFGNITISNASGVNVNGTVRVNGTLDFNAAGTVNTGGSNTMTIESTGLITNAASDRFVKGPLSRTYSSTGSFTYPVGSGSESKDATLNITTGTFGVNDSVTITIEHSTAIFTQGTLPTGIAAITQTSHYIVTNGGGYPGDAGYSFTGTFEDGNFSPETRNRVLVQSSATPTWTVGTTTPPGDINEGFNTVFASGFSDLPSDADLVAFGAGGTSLTWDGGAATDDWSLADNWNPNGVPTSQDDVTIDVPGVLTVTIGSATSAVASSLTLGDGADSENELLISSTSVTPLTVTNGITVDSDGKITFNASNGDISAGSTSFDPTSTVEYQARNIPVDDDYGNLIINGATGTTGSGTVTVAGDLTKDGAAFTASNAITVAGSYTNTTGNATYNGGLTVNGTPFTITSGIVAGSIAVNSTTTTVNGGSFGGTVTYSGTGAQTIGGTGTVPFANLTINNTNANITLNNPASVGGTLTLTDGLINTGTDLLTLGSSATVSGGGTGSHVNGPMATTGTGNKVFPIGAGGDYRPVELLSISGTTPVIQFEMTNGDPGGTADQIGVINISTIRWWQGTLNSGSFSSAQVKLEWGDDDVVNGALSDLRVATSASQGGTYASAGNSGTTGNGSSGTITSNSVSPPLQFYTLGSAAGDNSLPVTLSSFEAVPTSGGVSLTWVTESELENEGFNIYRRDVKGKSDWNIITSSVIPGRGNTSEKTEYEYLDQSVQAGLTYEYMLESISYTGVRVQEMVIEVTVPVPTEYTLLGNYPNPFNPNTNIRFRLPETSDVSIAIYGIQGNLVRELALNQSFEAGDHFISWDATDNTGQQVASGMYVYLFTAGKYQKTEKMLLLK
jgi:hypothetical protein